MTTSQKIFRQLMFVALIVLFGFSWLCGDVGLTILINNHIPSWNIPWAHYVLDFTFVFLALRTIRWARSRPPEESVLICSGALCAITGALGLVGALQAHVFTPLPEDHTLWSVNDEMFFGNLAAFTGLLALALGRIFLFHFAPSRHHISTQ